MVIKGFIFDFDGLIIDTEMPGCTAWSELYQQYGFTFTAEDWKKAIGTGPSAYDPARILFDLSNGEVDPKFSNKFTLNRARELIEMQPILPGLLDFLRKSESMKIPMAVASSSNRAWVEGYLEKLKLTQFFKTICTSDDVKAVKPDPELFLLAASRLRLDPSEVIVFEDSPNGVKSAKASGMVCIAIPNEITIDMDLSIADKIVSSFIELDPVELIRV